MMNRRALAAAFAASLVLSTGAVAQARSEMGRIEYESNWMGCHGPKGKGDGPYNEFLRVKVPDHTVVAKNNNGVFPADRLYEIIDGRIMVKGHGAAKMPIWGNVYNERAAEY